MAFRRLSRSFGTLAPARERSEAVPPSSWSRSAPSTCTGSMNWLSAPTARLCASASACWNLVVNRSSLMAPPVNSTTWWKCGQMPTFSTRAPGGQGYTRNPSADATTMKFELEWRIGKYPITQEIGRGATSRVYLARDPFADRDVAIKVFFFEENVSEQ